MATKSATKTCVCTKCLLEANSISNTTHRRCSGNPDNNTPRPKGENIPGNQRGKWQ